MRHLASMRVVFGIALWSAAAAACSIDVGGNGIVNREEKRFVVKGRPDLNVRTFDGSIQVRSWDRDEVVVEIERRGPDEASIAALTVNATQDGDRIVVEAPEPRNMRDIIHIGPSQSPSVSLLVTAPRTVNVIARTGDGSINADDLSGDVELNSGDGSIRATHVEGNLRIHTGDGSIGVTDAAGRVEAESGDGSVEVSGRIDALNVRTGDGSVRLDILDGSMLKSDWSVDTGDGSITVRLPASLDAELDAHTGDGGIHAEGLPIAAERDDRRDDNERRNSLRATLGKGGRTLRLQSGDGSINVSR